MLDAEQMDREGFLHGVDRSCCFDRSRALVLRQDRQAVTSQYLFDSVHIRGSRTVLPDGVRVTEDRFPRYRLGDFCCAAQLHSDFAPFMRVRAPEHFGSGAMSARVRAPEHFGSGAMSAT
jgi:hypothetical protein